MKNIDEHELGARSHRTRRTSLIGTIAIVAAFALAFGIVITVHNSSQPTVASPRPAATGTPARTPEAPPTGTSSTPPAEPSKKPTTSDDGGWTPRSTKKPAGINKRSETGPGLVFEIAEMKAVKGKAKLPGDIAGPAIRFTVKVTNTGDQTADLSTTVVGVFHGKAETPALQLNRSETSPLPAKLKADASAEGEYEFTVPVADRDQVLITVDHSVDSSIVAFEGSAPR